MDLCKTKQKTSRQSLWGDLEVSPSLKRKLKLHVQMTKKAADQKRRNHEASVDFIRQKFHYSDGKLFRILRDGTIGTKPVGANCNGYLSVYVKPMGRNVGVHRVVWTLHNGLIPSKMVIDHINRNRADNRIENLRLCTSKENGQNVVRKKCGASG